MSNSLEIKQYQEFFFTIPKGQKVTAKHYDLKKKSNNANKTNASLCSSPRVDFPISAQLCRCSFTTDECITCVFPPQRQGSSLGTGLLRSDYNRFDASDGFASAHLQRDTRLHCLHIWLPNRHKQQPSAGHQSPHLSFLEGVTVMGLSRDW